MWVRDEEAKGKGGGGDQVVGDGGKEGGTVRWNDEGRECNYSAGNGVGQERQRQHAYSRIQMSENRFPEIARSDSMEDTHEAIARVGVRIRDISFAVLGTNRSVRCSGWHLSVSGAVARALVDGTRGDISVLHSQRAATGEKVSTR